MQGAADRAALKAATRAAFAVLKGRARRFSEDRNISIALPGSVLLPKKCGFCMFFFFFLHVRRNR